MDTPPVPADPSDPRPRPGPPATPGLDDPVGVPPRRPLSRRRFIGVAGGVAGAAAVGGGVWAALVRDSVEQASPGATSTTSLVPATTTTAAVDVPLGEQVLVVLELAGGNDALNTLVPAGGIYRDARPNLSLGEGELVALAGTDFALHPALGPLAAHWDDATMAAVAGVGMTDQSRSHFKAMDTWWSAVPGAGSQTGWLGRWLDATVEGDVDPLRAIALGGGQRALVGTSSLATVVHSPEAFSLRTGPGVDNEALVEAFLATSAPLSAIPELAAAQSAIPSTIQAVELLASVAGDGTEGGDLFRGGAGTASSLLQTAAGIIDLGIGTRVITVGIGGFDTHSDQADRHAGLLSDVGEGIAAFVERLEADGNRDKVMVVTTSEFGRRVAENGSGGTDHGNGGVQFVLGPAVSGGQVVGEYGLDRLDNGDLPTVVDTRSVYSAALDWLGGPTDELLDGPHDRLGLLSA